MLNPRRMIRGARISRGSSMRAADGVLQAHDRIGVADVVEVDPRDDLAGPEANQAREPQVDHRDRRQPLVAALASETVWLVLVRLTPAADAMGA